MADSSPVLFVTGGASGIGAACAQQFAAQGWRVAIGDIQEEKGRALAGEIGANAAFHRLDVRSEADFERALAATVAQWGRLDCMLNNAAIVGVIGPVTEIAIEQFDATYEIVLRSVFLGAKHALRIMQPAQRGTVVNIASVAGLTTGFGPHVYNLCKAAVVHFTKSLAVEMAEHGIRVNAICPGNVETPIQTGVTDERWKTRMEKIRREHTEDQPIPRMGLPEEIAQAVWWLANDTSSYVTGHALVVDGGLMAGKPWRHQPHFLKEYHPIKLG
ncbi:MAG: glucose 1-dehydrogenase [Gammaproteobacteria bacterium]|nr:glucose 1-dehydrogenase [Gammaproteobacteria bacterium]MBI5615697.1 glucose 1-dehydrogenase [Gammaproteobacteria bacterium]